jgi:tetratricopeptide (TPR) repeat protein
MPKPTRTTLVMRTLGLVVLAGGLVGGGCRSSPSGEGSGGFGTREIAEARDDIMRGEAALARGDRDAALQLFARAIEVNPRLTRAHLGMAEVYRMSGDFESAERSARTAVELEPNSFDTQYAHGLMLHLLNRFADAVGAYVRALRIQPGDFQANLNLATAYYQLGEPSQALPFAEAAVRLRPQDGRARFNLGVIYAALDQHEQGVAEYQQAAELMELSPPLLLNLAESLGRLNRYTEMRNTLERLIEIEPTAAAYERLGFARFRLGDFDGARGAFEQSLKLDPRYYPALNGLGVCDLNQWLLGDRRDNAMRERALGSLRQSLIINRNQPRIEELLSRFR